MSLALVAVPPQPSTSEAQPACTWSIGIMGALRGDYANYGRPAANGVKLAVHLANESGELACSLDTHPENTQGDPNQAPAKAQRLVDDENLVACVCGFFSGETLASGSIFREAGVAMLSTGEISEVRRQRFRTWFRLIAPGDQQATSTGNYIRKAVDARRVAIVHDGQSYSREIAQKVAAALGWRFEGPFIRLNPEESSEPQAAREVKRRKPDAVFYGGYANEAWVLWGALREEGVKVPFLTDGGAKIASEARDAKAGRARLSCACTDPTEIDRADTFVAEYRERFGATPTQHAPDTFDGTNFVIDALRSLSGSESTEEVRAHVVSYLEGLTDAQGTVKSYSWDEVGELEASSRHVWIWAWSRRHGFQMLGTVARLTN